MSGTALFLPANPNPTPSPTYSFTPPASTSGVLRLPRHARARTYLPAAFGSGSPADGRREKDYYATLQEVKASYRTLARKIANEAQNIPIPGTTNIGNFRDRNHHQSARTKRSFWWGIWNLFRSSLGESLDGVKGPFSYS